VLAYPENRSFATECEKIAHLCDERDIDPEALPAKVFRGRDGASSTRRCFLARFPLFTHPGAEDLTFCYVESGFEGSGPFATHLRRHLPLFGDLPSLQVVYVSTASTRLCQAQTVFERALSRGRKWLTNVADPERLLAHSRDCKLFEKREISTFDRLRLDAWPDDLCCFPGRHFAQMFARWEICGDEAIRAEIAAQKMPNGRFSSCILPHDYDLFGRVVEAS
jgi:hypothetical protein